MKDGENALTKNKMIKSTGPAGSGESSLEVFVSSPAFYPTFAVKRRKQTLYENAVNH